ncbi:MAG: hypothetical protein K2N73_11085 [Lachnospiraceae bacterium]|nr:hypothetical protein [Lachnospiraceae bacterium]
MKRRILLAVVIYIVSVAGGAWTHFHSFCSAVTLPVFTLAYIAVWTLLELWVQLVWMKKKLLYQTMTILAGVSGVWMIVMMAVVRRQLQNLENFKILIFAVFAGWLLTMHIIRVFLAYQWESMGRLVSDMDKVSRGEYDITPYHVGVYKKIPDNEFGAMWAALERMCTNLRIQKYRHFKETAYLYEYTPRNFEQLFEKEKLQDIELGDTVQIVATLGILAMIDRNVLLTGALQKKYVRYVNRLMEVLFSQRESDKAIFLQNGSNLENVKVVFQGQSALAAVRYSIDCMEALAAQTEDEYNTTPFILLHTSEFSCGLAGGSRQVYPYVTSLEMETLNQYIDELKAGGTRIVVTESTWQHAGEHLQGRFIGYVTSGDGKITFRLHEILDACPQSQKAGKLKNKEKFERALQLYYDNDLYLARSTFADILEECPEDGIARWYVFACEERFNSEDSLHEGHELFR